VSNKFYTSLAFLSPVVIILLAVSYLAFSNSTFWATDSNSTAGAMMGFAEVILLAIAVAIGCISGIIFAIKSIYVSKSKLSITALISNAIPLLLMAIFLTKWLIFGI